MPLPFVALLAAHGLSMDGDDIWSERTEEALISGCLYQLAHPEEKYYNGFRSIFGGVQTPLILRLENKMKRAVFKLSGLTQKDVRIAKNLAQAIDPTEGDDYVSSFLLSLNGRSTLSGGFGAESPLELPLLC
jgi:hypothetical protein